MIRNVLESIGGVGLYAVVSLLIFFGFFTLMLVWVLRMRKSHLDHMRSLPLDGGEVRHER